MASLYKRERSPYWWVKYTDTAGELRRESTKLRHAFPGESRKAWALRNEISARESANDSSAGIGQGPEMWRVWVPRLIKQRYATSPLTLDRAKQCWRNVAAFLDEKSITVPRQLERQHVRDFIEWRADAHPESRTHKGAKNTALLEIKFLALIIDEAIASGFCNSNPCKELGIGRDEPKLKPAIIEAEHRLITRSLKLEPEWMRVSYKIAWEQGCRFSETMLDLARDVDLAHNVLRLRTKGKKKRVAEVPLSPKLRPLFRRLIKHGRKSTFEKSVIAKGGNGKVWWKFFRKIGLGHLSFHCTRVSFITRCYLAGIPEETVMRICLHASTTVHRIYPRLPAASQHLQDAIRKVAA